MVHVAKQDKDLCKVVYTSLHYIGLTSLYANTACNITTRLGSVSLRPILPNITVWHHAPIRASNRMDFAFSDHRGCFVVQL